MLIIRVMIKLDLDIRELVGRVRGLVCDALARSGPAKAWDLLQERDSEGYPKGPLPYTNPAIHEFHVALERNPDDIGLIHHLAIGHHARAWNLELAGDPTAEREWKRALGYWRQLAASSEFWAEIKDKFLSCDPRAELGLVEEIRGRLLEDLLDVHVDFVHHYCEQGAPERAVAHVDIVKRAQIPPVVKKRLVKKVFEAMTGSVPEAVANGAYESALTTVERFLVLFPDYPSALRMHVEICKEQVSNLSYKDDWDEIIRIGGRAEKSAKRLRNHPHLENDPLAGKSLVDLAGELALRGYDRGEQYFAARNSGSPTVRDREESQSALEFGIKWARPFYPLSPSGHLVRKVLPACLHGRAVCLFHELQEITEADLEERIKIDTLLALNERAIAYLEEALGYNPDSQQVAEHLEIFRRTRSELESRRRMIDLLGNLKGNR